MTTYAHREIVSRRVEYGVKAPIAAVEVDKMFAVAWQDFCARRSQPLDSRQSDDWAQIGVGDGEIVIAFTVEADASDDGPEDWKGVSRDEVIRQADEYRDEWLKWRRRHDDRRAERDTALERIYKVRTLLSDAETLGWDEVLRPSGDDIPQAIRRLLAD